VARFDLYPNPNPRASHRLYLDVQSDLVLTSTRWCLPLLPLLPANAAMPLLSGAQLTVVLDGQSWVLDAPNFLAVPTALLRQARGRLLVDDQLRVEAALDFMLRGC
jgi:hypothetical protein